MASKSLVLEIILKAFDQASKVITGVEAKMKGFDEAMQRGEGLRKTAQGMATVGAISMATGGAIAYPLIKMTEAAAEEQGERQHLMTAMGNSAEATKALNAAMETNQKIAENSVLSTKDLGDMYYLAVSNGQSFAEAQKTVASANNLVIGTTQNAAQAQASAADTARMLSSVQKLTGVSTDVLADQFAKLQTAYAFRDIGEVTDAWKYLGGVVTALHIPVSEVNADIAVLSQNMIHGGQAGTAMRQIFTVISTGGAHDRLVGFQKTLANGNLDMAGTIDAITEHVKGMSTAQEMAFLKDSGFQSRTAGAMAILIAKHQLAIKMTQDLEHAGGYAAMSAKERMLAADYQWAVFTNRLQVLAQVLGNKLLPVATKIIDKISSVVVTITEFAKAHPAITRIVLDFAAIVSGVLLVGGGLALASSAMLGFVSFLPAVGKLIALFRLGGVVTKIWTAAQWLLNAAMDANPIGLAIIAIAVLAFGVYEVYKHWQAIKSLWERIKAPSAGEVSPAVVETHGFLSTIGKGMEAVVSGVRWALDKIGKLVFEFIPKMFDAGVMIIKEIGLGILHGVESTLKGVLTHVGKTIKSYFPFSPAREGPLRDLEDVQIVETIADAINRSHALVGNALSRVFGSAWQSIKSFAGAGAANILHGLMGTESSYGKMLTNPASSAIGPYQMTRGFRQTWGVTPEQAMSMGTSTAIANKVIFGHYMPEFGGDISKALSAWHQGEGWVRAHGVDKPYVDSVMRHTPASAAGGGGVTINVHYAPVIHGATPEDLNKHADHIVRIVKNKLGRDSRLRYD